MSEATEKFIADMAQQLEQYLADTARDQTLSTPANTNDIAAVRKEKPPYLRLVYSSDDAN